MSKKITQKIILAGVIIKNNKVLIIQRHKNEKIFPNMWELPSGKKEPLEPSENSLIREIREETGINIKVIIPFSVFDYQIEKEDEIRDSTQINFLVKSTGRPVVKLSSEHQMFAWIKKDEINKYNLTKNTKNVIQEAFDLVDFLKSKK